MKKSLIGRGTFGKVHKLLLESGEAYALKEFSNQSTDSELKLQTFREIKFLKQLQHANIIQIVEVIVEENSVSLLMPFYAKDLEKEIEKIHTLFYTEEEFKQWFLIIKEQIFTVVEYLHSKQIVHRDIKPSNFLIDEHNQIKLIDFGNAYHYHQNEFVKANFTTPEYRPPEGDLNIAVKPYSIDVFSVGCVLFKMISNKTFLSLSPKEDIFNLLKTIYDFDVRQFLANPSIDDIPTTVFISKPFVERSIPCLNKVTYDFFNKLLNLNSNLRPTPSDCLKLIIF